MWKEAQEQGAGRRGERGGRRGPGTRGPGGGVGEAGRRVQVAGGREEG